MPAQVSPHSVHRLQTLPGMHLVAYYYTIKTLQCANHTHTIHVLQNTDVMRVLSPVPTIVCTGIQSLSLVGRYPVADVSYTIPGFPVEVSLEAFRSVRAYGHPSNCHRGSGHRVQRADCNYRYT